MSAASCTGTAGSSAWWTSGAASPIATTDAARAVSAVAQIREVPALELPAEDHDQPGIEALDGAQRGLDVGGLRVVDEPHAADLGDRLERVLETGEALDRARHRVRLDAGQRRHGRRRRARPPADAGRAA